MKNLRKDMDANGKFNLLSQTHIGTLIFLNVLPSFFHSAFSYVQIITLSEYRKNLPRAYFDERVEIWITRRCPRAGMKNNKLYLL